MSQSTRNSAEGTWLGFDYGLRRIGVAVGQTLTGQANPLSILECDQGTADWQSVEALIKEWRPVTIVVGLPRHADGSDNDISPRARRFARQVEGRFQLPVLMVDEHLSSHAARDMATAAGDRRGAKAAIDDWAAACILQDGLAGLGQALDELDEKQKKED